MNSHGGKFPEYDADLALTIMQYCQLLSQHSGNLVFANNANQSLGVTLSQNLFPLQSANQLPQMPVPTLPNNFFPQLVNQQSFPMPMFSPEMVNFWIQNSMQNFQMVNQVQPAEVVERALKDIPIASTNPSQFATQQPFQFTPTPNMFFSAPLANTVTYQFPTMFPMSTPIVNNVVPPTQTQSSQPTQENPQEEKETVPMKVEKKEDGQKKKKAKKTNGTVKSEVDPWYLDKVSGLITRKFDYSVFTDEELNEHIKLMKAEKRRREINLDSLQRVISSGHSIYEMLKNGGEDEEIEGLEEEEEPRANNHKYGKYFPAHFRDDMIDFLTDPKNRDGVPYTPIGPIGRRLQRELNILTNKIYEHHLIFLLIDGYQLVEDDVKFLRNRGIEPDSYVPIIDRNAVENEVREEIPDNDELMEDDQEQGFAELVARSPQPE